jgi:hypothetical protein
MNYWLARDGAKTPEGPYGKGVLRRMYEAGTAEAMDQVCPAGTEAWQDLGQLLDLRAWREAQAAQVAAVETVVLAKKKRKAVGSSGCAILLLGLIMLAFFWPVGVILIGAALVVDHLSVKLICTACGNVTVRTARQCAVCDARFKN